MHAAVQRDALGLAPVYCQYQHKHGLGLCHKHIDNSDGDGNQRILPWVQGRLLLLDHPVRKALLFLLGALPFLVYWGGTPDAMTWPKWVSIAALAPLCLCFEEDSFLPPAPLFWSLAAIAVTIWWSPDRLSGVDDFVHLLILASVFWLGYQARELRALWIGIAAAITANVVLVVAQVAGFTGVPQAAVPAGTLVNRNFMGEACALLLAFSMGRGNAWRAWAFVPFVGLLLTGSKAGLAGFIAAVAVYLSGTKFRLVAWVLAVGLTLALAFVTLTGHPSMVVRLSIWFPTLSDLKWLGHGLSSFAVWDPYDEWAHNEVFHALYEQGLLALPALVLAGAAVWKAFNDKTSEALVVVVFAVVALFGFPLHVAPTALIGALAAGWVLGRGPALRDAAEPHAVERGHDLSHVRKHRYGDSPQLRARRRSVPLRAS